MGFQHEADGFKKWVNKYDSNKDGLITRLEFSQVFKHHKKGKLVKKHKGKVVKKPGLKKIVKKAHKNVHKMVHKKVHKKTHKKHHKKGHVKVVIGHKKKPKKV